MRRSAGPSSASRSVTRSIVPGGGVRRQGPDVLVHPGVEALERAADGVQLFGVACPEEDTIAGALERDSRSRAHLADAEDRDGGDSTGEAWCECPNDEVQNDETMTNDEGMQRGQDSICVLLTKG